MKKILFYIFLFILAFLLSPPEAKAREMTGELNFKDVSVWIPKNLGANEIWDYDPYIAQPYKIHYYFIPADTITLEWQEADSLIINTTIDTIYIVYLPKSLIKYKLPVKNNAYTIYQNRISWCLGYKTFCYTKYKTHSEYILQYYDVFGKEIDKPQVYFEINKD